MESQSLRIRLIFDDCSVLTLAQRSDGMNHSWILIEPNQLPKISDVCNHLLHKFNLHSSCPNGILLFMEGFVLPQSESTRILNDKDIICVKRKGVALAQAIEGVDACNLLNGEINRREPVDNGVLLLANEEFDKENGGYQSESEDAEVENSEDKPLPKETTSKKRKPSTKLRSSKKKKHRLVVMNGVDDEVATEDNGVNNDECSSMKITNKKITPNKEKRSGESETIIEKAKSPSKVKRKKKHRSGVVIGDEDELVMGEIDNINNGESILKKKISKKKMKPNEEIKKANSETSDTSLKHDVEGMVIGDEDEIEIGEIVNVNNGESILKKKISKKKIKPNEEIKKANAETSDKNTKDDVEGVEQTSTAPDEVEKVPSRSARRKKAKRQWRRELAKSSQNLQPVTLVEPEISKTENKVATDHPEGSLKQDQVPAKVMHKNIIEQEGRNHKLVPCVVRPGHIRFEPLDEDEDAKQTEVPDVAFQWNGITSKKKGQKWGLEKFSTSKRDDSQKETEEPSTMLTVDVHVPLIDLIAFDQLPLCSSPKEGDVIAYRVLELSSSWTPELSSFRVGKISYYDADNIVLMPVPEYPIVLNEVDENGPDNSLYKEDGSLEIKFAALADVRSLKQSNSDAVKAVSNGVNQNNQVDEKDAASNLMSSSNDKKENLSKDPSPVEGNNNTWDELEELLSAKKSALLESNKEMKKDSEWNKWSYRALRGSALGPTISLLRSGNDI